jgi:hypothetical protein
VSNPRRRFGAVPDHRAVLLAVVLLAVAGIALFPQASNAALGRNQPITGQKNGQNNIQNQTQNQTQNKNKDKNKNNQGQGQGQGQSQNKAQVNGLTILGDTCAGSKLQAHDGFQNGNKCVDTQFGEVGNSGSNPSLLITKAPQEVRVNQAFELRVSTRNLVRDRFLAAGQGGYYLESSFLAADGSVRGHFHTACRMLADTQNAPNPDPVPAFFVATEDGKGGRNPDTVTVKVSGLPTAGTAQCAVWAGDGSHRTPMMQRANQTPAFDVVRVQVR